MHVTVSSEWKRTPESQGHQYIHVSFYNTKILRIGVGRGKEKGKGGHPEVKTARILSVLCWYTWEQRVRGEFLMIWNKLDLHFCFVKNQGDRMKAFNASGYS